MKLHESTAAITQFYALVADTELDPQVIEDTLSSLLDDLNGKVESIAFILRKLKAEQQFYKDEEERIKVKREVLSHRQERLKQYLAEQLELVGLDRVDTPTATVRFQNNPPSVQVEDEEKIPETFVRYVKQIDRKSLLQALKNGELIEGCQMVQGRGLRIR